MTRKTKPLLRLETSASPAVKPPRGVLERGLSILACFSTERLRLSLRELAELTGLDKATLLRLLAVLLKERMVLRLESGQYVPGPALLHYGMLYRRNSDLGELLQPVLREVMQRTGETVAFYVKSADERVCLYRENSVREVRHHVEPGTRVPLSAGGASAHILKYFSGLETPHAADIARDGQVLTRAERVPEMASIALPVLDQGGEFLGSLVIMGLASRQSVQAQVAGANLARRLLAEQGFETTPPTDWRRPQA